MTLPPPVPLYVEFVPVLLLLPSLLEWLVFVAMLSTVLSFLPPKGPEPALLNPGFDKLEEKVPKLGLEGESGYATPEPERE